MLEPVEINFILASTSFVFWEWTERLSYYWRNDVRIVGKIPNRYFAPIWLLLKAALIVVWVFHLNDRYIGAITFSNGIYVAQFVLLFVNEILRKSWTVFAADYNRLGAATLIGFLLAATGVGECVVLGLGVHQNPIGTQIAALVLYSLYSAWLIIALFYTVQHYYQREPMVRWTSCHPMRTNPRKAKQEYSLMETL